MPIPLIAAALVLTLQAEPGPRIAGRILDARTGAPLPEVVVTLSEAGLAGRTDARGRYRLTAAGPGPAHLAVERFGYRSRILHVLVPRSGSLEVDVALEPRPIEVDPMVVPAPRPVRGVDPDDRTAFPDRGISAAALRNHPLLAQPDGLRALSGGEVLIDPEAGTGVHVRGGAADHTAYVIDGIPVFSPYHAAGLFSAWNPDALAGLSLSAAAPPPTLPDALAGVVAATTREPGARLRVETAVSNTEGRVTVDGPAGPVGYLLSWRTGLAGSLFANSEDSYLSGEVGDLLATARVDVLGGRLRLIHYEAENEIATASAPTEDAAVVPRPGNGFDWGSRSTGATWSRAWSRTSLRVSAWRAAQAARSEWRPDGDGSLLETGRRDLGLEVGLTRAAGRSSTDAGVRLRRLTTRYHASAATEEPSWDPDESSFVPTVYAQHATDVAPFVHLRVAATASVVGRLHVAPRGEIRGRISKHVEVSVSAGRTLQFSQSMRNPESPVGHVFPADLFVGSGAEAVPVPHADQVVFAAAWRPTAGVRLGGQVYGRRTRNLVLVAPTETGPFATGRPSTGTGAVRGAALDLAANAARYAVVASYGWQRNRLAADGAAYVPREAASHVLEAGVIVFPSSTTSIRLATFAEAGRRVTPTSGPFEWEACNLLDQGCEFAGAPRLDGALGRSELPPYVRFDVGARKHWHVRAGGRDLLLGVFGTVTNVLGRTNVLTWVVDAETGQPRAVEMLSRVPLVVGLDARF